MKKNILGAAGLLTAGLLAGGAMSIGAANAADTTAVTSVASTTSTDSSTTAPADLGTPPAGAPDIFSATSVRPDEKNVTGADKTKLETAALAEVPGATVIRAETDGNDGATYEVHMKRADGTVVTVEFDADFKVTGTHEGFGKGGPDGGQPGGHGPRGPQDGSAAGGFTAPTIDSTTTQNG